jgi:hypothetical protein
MLDSNKIKNRENKLKYELKSFKYNWVRSKRYIRELTEKEVRYCMSIQFERRMGYKLNLDNPKTLSEKIQWLKLYYHNPLMTKCADKVEARNYIKDIVGEKYLVPFLGVYNNPKEIEFEKLPDQFIIKTNWGCKQNILCKDKSAFNKDSAIQKLTDWIKPKNNFYYKFFEWQYKNIKPKIVCEKLLLGKDGKIVKNYKFFCFNGKFKYLMIPTRYKENAVLFNFYDRNLNLQPFTYGDLKNNKEQELKIDNYDEMINVAEKLAQPFPLVRVDMYEDGDNNVYIGELTFTPNNGAYPFDPVEWDYKLGELLTLPSKI